MNSSREVTGIAKFYQPEKIALYLGAAASEETVKSNKHLSTARRIHFATHGLISERLPQLSGLVLTLDEDAREDGLLQVYEIFNLKLSADLVVLSACRTGLGKEVRGEGVIGLTRAFLSAGASTV
ncbi:MAG TPA: CHAT domain-containing protein, partial [Pyrinomonadaceae bacterium]